MTEDGKPTEMILIRELHCKECKYHGNVIEKSAHDQLARKLELAREAIGHYRTLASKIATRYGLEHSINISYIYNLDDAEKALKAIDGVGE
jgi:hypothetical protein